MENKYLLINEVNVKYQIPIVRIRIRIKNGQYRTDKTGEYVLVEDVLNLINNPNKSGAPSKYNNFEDEKSSNNVEDENSSSIYTRYLTRTEITNIYKISRQLISIRVKTKKYRTDKSGRYICVEDVINLINNSKKPIGLFKSEMKGDNNGNDK